MLDDDEGLDEQLAEFDAIEVGIDDVVLAELDFVEKTLQLVEVDDDELELIVGVIDENDEIE